MSSMLAAPAGCSTDKTVTIYTTSRNRQTPANVHLIQLALVLSCAVNTSSLKRASVVYTGHEYVSFCSALSAVTARTRMTGMGQNSSLGLESSSTPALSSQRAPSNVRPVMNAPSLQGVHECKGGKHTHSSQAGGVIGVCRLWQGHWHTFQLLMVPHQQVVLAEATAKHL